MKNKIKLLMLDTLDYKGSGSASLQEMEYINSLGYDAKLVVYDKTSTNSNVIPVLKINNSIIRFCYKVLNRLIRYSKVGFMVHPRYLFLNVNLNKISAEKILKLYGDTPDIINVRWITNFVNFETIYNLQKITGAKVLFSMMDNSNITGGCHYPYNCNGYKENCNPCPALRKCSKRAMRTLNNKKKYLPENVIITGTTNDIIRAKSSSLFKNATFYPSVFIKEYSYSISNEKARQEFKIPKDAFIISFGSKDIQEERKGFKYLIEALDNLIADNITKPIILLVAGMNAPSLKESKINIKFLGTLNEKDLFKMYYASDIFVCPSVEDSGPLMINQAFLCNIPVVSFRMGVASDLIIHQENGYIANLYDVKDLKEGIKYFYYMNPSDINKISRCNLKLLDNVRKKKSIKYILEDITKND
jgi:glycosyltransferase involved in cell wall biosynthesis